MTFAEYNTDENFNNDKSSLDELVKIGLSEGKTSDEIKSSLSPKWQKSKKIGEFDNYVSKYSTPKAEEKKPTEEKVVEAVAETSEPTEKAPTLDNGEEKYLKDQQKRADRAEMDALNKIDSQAEKNWLREYDTTSRMTDAYKRIDDKLIAQIPTFMTKRYVDGEFGDPKSSDAKLRLAHFMINGLGTALSNAGHIIRKDGVQEQSDIEKYQQTNLEEGLQNRWNKYKQETQSAIDLAKKEGMNEQDARLAVEQLTRDRNVNTVWNMMDSNQKLYAMEVTKKIGDYIGKMDISELGDFIAGAAYEGTMDKDKAVAIGIAKLAVKAPEIISNLPEGNIKDMVFSMIGGNGVPVTAGIGGVGGKTDSNGNQTNLTGNLQNYETINGDKVSFDFTDSKAKEKITAITDDLKDKYANGEIDAETFKKYYDPIYSEMIKHPSAWGSVSKSDKVLNQIKYDKLNAISSSFEELNSMADSGEISTSDYKDQYEDILANAKKWGADEKLLNSLEKNKKSDAYILKKVEKAAKKKKK